MLTPDGTRPLIVDRFLDTLARAPAEHMRQLARRRARIVFAPTVPEALDSRWASDRRGRTLSPQERLDVRIRYSREAGTVAVYDPELDALVLPTSYAAHDYERVVMHELGHALTMPSASIHPGLLQNLPPAIARHVNNPAYGDPREPGTLRSRVHEALAEAYVYLVAGRAEELPQALTSDLLFILTTVTDGNAHVRFDFDEDTGRTASFIDPNSLPNPDCSQPGFLARPARHGEALEALEALDLEQDELAPRRRHRRAA